MATPSAVTSALATSLPHASGPEATTTTKNSKTPLRFRHPDYTKEAAPESSGDENDYSDGDEEGETTAVDELQDDNYVRKVLSKEKPLPPITLKNWYKEINVISTLALTLVPIFSIYGALTTQVQMKTVLWAILY